jgi:hypothetical protein
MAGRSGHPESGVGGAGRPPRFGGCARALARGESEGYGERIVLIIIAPGTPLRNKATDGNGGRLSAVESGWCTERLADFRTDDADFALAGFRASGCGPEVVAAVAAGSDVQERTIDYSRAPVRPSPCPRKCPAELGGPAGASTAGTGMSPIAARSPPGGSAAHVRQHQWQPEDAYPRNPGR